MTDKNEIIKLLQTETKDLSIDDIIKYFFEKFPGNVALASSMAAEDQVLTDIICKNVKVPKIFTLDTGRLPKETYDTIEATRYRYEIDIEIMFPNSDTVEQMVNKKGPNLFYNSIEDRKQCCYVRKVEPLQRALTNLDVWICGLRKQQSVTRYDLEIIEWDEQFGLIKLSPLLDWSTTDVWNYIKDNNVPYNSLHDKGYPSIGCEPCTRAITEGQDIRAGRWWWENPEQKECGLHIKK